jgi:hypothetical protein
MATDSPKTGPGARITGYWPVVAIYFPRKWLFQLRIFAVAVCFLSKKANKNNILK